MANSIIKIFAGVFVLSFIALSGCYYDNEQELYDFVGSTICDSSNVTYSGTVSKIISSNCLVCHGGTYATTGGNVSLQNAQDVAAVAKQNNNTQLYNNISAVFNYNMPKSGNKLSFCQIRQIKIWIDNGCPND